MTDSLRDSVAKGIRRANYTRSSDSSKAWELKPESEWVLQDVEAIVPEDLWSECNAVLDAQREKGKRTTQPTLHLFAGLTYCACGPKMYVLSNSPKYTCQKCRNKIPKDDLEAVFIEQIKHFSISPDEISAHLERANITIPHEGRTSQRSSKPSARSSAERSTNSTTSTNPG